MVIKVGIIGGGFSGIYALKYCIQEKLECKLFEGSDTIGGIWKYNKNKSGGVFKNTHASSSIGFLHPTDYPFPEDTPEFPHHSLIYQHLEKYIDHFNLRKYIQLNTYIKHIIKKNNKWIVTYFKDEIEINEIFDKIIICTGIHQKPHIPEDKYYENFPKEKIIHSHYYEENKEKFKDKNVIIIGGGETAHDIACELAIYSKHVYMSIRNGQWFQGKIVSTNEAADLFFNRFMYYIWGKPYIAMIGFANEIAWGDGGTGIKEWKPKNPYSSSFLTKGREHLIWISKGKITPCGKITNIKDNIVNFDTCNVAADYIILCTGYENTHLKTLLPKTDYDKDKFKLVFDPDDHSLSYCGFIRPVITSITSICELQARVISKLYSNQIQLPEKNEMIKIIHKDLNLRKERFRKDWHRLKYLIEPYGYSDELASLIKCKPNMLKLFFTNNYLWRILFFYPWSQFHYTINSENEEIRKISLHHLEKNKNCLAGIRLRYMTDIETSCIIICTLIIIGCLYFSIYKSGLNLLINIGLVLVIMIILFIGNIIFGIIFGHVNSYKSRFTLKLICVIIFVFTLRRYKPNFVEV